MRYTLFASLFLATFFFAGLAAVQAQQPPICKNGIGHLIWSGTVSNGTIPYLNGLNTLSGSPITTNGQKVDVNGPFSVFVNGQERLAIKEQGGGTTQAPSKFLRPAYAQTQPTTRIDLFAGKVYFLKRGTNSDISLHIGDEKTDVGAIKIMGLQQPNLSLYDEKEKLRTQVQYYNDATRVQHWKGYSEATPNVPYNEVFISDNAGLPVVKIIGGKTYQDRKLILEITEGE